MSRYYSFSAYLRDKFPGQRVYKIALDAGFTCPHRTGPDRLGGCIYCENRSFSPNAQLDPRPSVTEQIRMGMDFYRRRYQADKFIAYFQAYSNTFGSPEVLKARYDEALAHPDVIGLSIGTRPDCISDEVINLIASYTNTHTVWVEYGLQSANDNTLKLINRGHSYADFVSAVKRTQGRNILIGTHLIIGLPGETREDILDSVRKVVELGIDPVRDRSSREDDRPKKDASPFPKPVPEAGFSYGSEPDISNGVNSIKLHHLYVARNTELAKLHDLGRVRILPLEEYVPLVCDILEILPPKMVVQRVTGELSGEYLIAPKWGVSKGGIIRMIEDELARRDSHQGIKYKG